MNLTSSLPVILDANILYSAPLRDYLLNLANETLFRPKWSETIHDEWIGNLLKNRPDIQTAQLEKLKQAMNDAFPDASIINDKTLENKLTLPDPKDRHVLAAAIRAKAELIITFNLKDFPQKHLKPYNVSAIHPDKFIIKIIKSDQSGAVIAFNNQIKSLKHPPLTAADVLKTFENLKLTESAKALRKLL